MNNPQTILGIETSCDETGVAIVKKKDDSYTILANELASSLTLHAETGGIIPEQAAREQLKYILPLIETASKTVSLQEIDAIAVTYGPGLIGSLLVGVETAKTLSYVLKKPIIPVNHLHGHIYANWLEATSVQFPALALVVSGGHTDLVIMQDHNTVEVIGGTRDDAAGEAFDKIGRLLGLPYPAGATISKLAEKGDTNAFHFPRPLIGSDDFDFSFSGLKTAVLREVMRQKKMDQAMIADICAATQEAIIDVLVKKTIKAAIFYKVKTILLGGGVSANNKLRERLKSEIRNLKLEIPISVPSPRLCTDNGAMIAVAGFFAKPVPWQEITANPELYY